MQPQVILTFVGHDNSGKTSIAMALANKIGIPYFKNRNEKRREITDSNIYGLYYETPLLLSLCTQTNSSFIFDRGYPCEYAYSQAFNRKTDLPFLWKMDEEWSKLNHRIVYCYKTFLKDFIDDMVKLEQVKAIKENYEKFLSKTKCSVLKLDTTNEDLAGQLFQIQRFIEWI